MAKKSFFKDYANLVIGSEKRLLKGIGRGIRKGVEAVDKKVFPSSYARDKASYNRTQVKKATPGTFKTGGKVNKTGVAKVHKGERVLNKKQTKKWDAKKFEAARKKVYNLK